ncbi:MAG: glutathione peroxidase [Steroidobacteraceae bacterium]
MTQLSMSARTMRMALLALLAGSSSWAAECPAWLNQDFRKLRSNESVNLCKLADGKPLLIVNTASHCGFTPQFQGLEALHEKYKDRGLVVVGFPSDSFNQEAKDDAETAEICYINYGVKFTMLAASPVKGADANGVFKELARQSTEPGWNFNKYLVKPDGTVVRHYDSKVTPDSPELNQDIEAILAKPAAR